jgi:hypothetical protein
LQTVKADQPVARQPFARDETVCKAACVDLQQTVKNEVSCVFRRMPLRGEPCCAWSGNDGILYGKASIKPGVFPTAHGGTCQHRFPFRTLMVRRKTHTP